MSVLSPFSGLRPLDYFLLVLSIAVTVGTVFWVFGGSAGGGAPLVQIQSVDGTYLYPLSEDRDISVKGPAGTTYIRIENEEAFAVESPGPLRIIMQMGKISKQGEWLASLPNRVFVRIVSPSGDSSRDDIDASVF